MKTLATQMLGVLVAAGVAASALAGDAKLPDY